MTIQQIEYFEEVFRIRVMRKAAENLYVSQPAISTVIKNLEKELGVTLFLRSNPLIPTEAGVRFHKLASDLLARRDSITNEMMAFKNELSPFDVGFSIVSRQILNIPADQIIKGNPSLRSLKFYPGSYLKECILDHKMDIAIIATVQNIDHIEDKFNYVKLMNTSLSFYVSKDNPLSALRTISPEQIKDKPLGAFSDEPISTEEYLRTTSYLIGTELNNQILLSTSNLTEIEVYIANGTLCAIMLDGMFKNNRRIKAIPIESDRRVDIVAIWNKDHYLSIAESRLIKGLEKYVSIIKKK